MNRLLEFNVSTTPPSYVQKNTEQWDAHELRAQVPAPPTEYWSGHMLDGHYVARLDYTSYESIKAYAQELQDAGFIYRQIMRCDPGWDQYYYIGANEAGYTVWLIKASVEVSGLHASRLLIYPPEADDSPADWSSIHGFGTYLPAPPCADWVYTIDPTGNRIQFGDMGYRTACQYLNRLQGLNLAPTTFLEEDREAKKFVFSAGIYSEEIKGRIVFSFRFSYDPTAADCPCTLEET
jgi:hypothetical protein